MQTALADFIRDTAQGREADAILRACVHCGFCNATCPTYQLLGDELDGPRGRIYLVKQMLEGAEVSRRTLAHLDRCLTCRNCETTCPSGVQYGRLADIGRELIEEKVKRRWSDRFARWALRKITPYPARFTPLLRLGQFSRPLLPPSLKRKIPRYRRTAAAYPPLPPGEGRGEGIASRAISIRKMLVLEGCVQPAIAPNINAAAARVLDRLGIRLIAAKGAGCCGAVCHHTSGVEEGLAFARRNIDAWWPHTESGCEAIVMTASGCGAHVKEYGHLLQADPNYAARARRVSELTKDISEILAGQDLSALKPAEAGMKVVFHSPCTLQHGQNLNGVVEGILRGLGFTLTPVPDAHLCCGSAGTYSILQPELSQRLLKNKVDALQSGHPDVIATANIGCLAHLQSGSTVPVRHWVELVASQG
ncbi:MAG: glycolate oxidase iron-sulfur subunit [Candidatus Muproteobacteria bacterium RBG_16_65_34]|uniref:Glycolate oxidase iron-sulfur subunit n=1 Tax=Candidatus Muproteobacteria bacterium RBG_16_65_34 TaxID=1817760 RepID=A0A1F6TVR7_9PROT|nr:MAG: glycolate oxidase iron-sulfur subunit [Candidatus Muproteobacteria bacterium RBG_16_65_34]